VFSSGSTIGSCEGNPSWGSGIEAGGAGGELASIAGGNSGCGNEAEGASRSILIPACGDLLKTFPRKGLNSSSSALALALDGVLLAAEAIPPPTRLIDLGVISSGRVGVGASLTILLVAKRAARASEGLSKVNWPEALALGNFCGDLDLRRSKASGLFRDMLALVGDAYEGRRLCGDAGSSDAPMLREVRGDVRRRFGADPSIVCDFCAN
jgi:hypothetical protein